MKKCPYCNTFLNDDEKVCTNCLKDVSNIDKMKDIAPTKYKKSYSLGLFGIIFIGGGIIASLSQRFNRINNYFPKYDELRKQIEAAPAGTNVDKLKEEASKYLANMNTCLFREIFFYIVAGLGLVMIIISIIFYFKERKKA